MKSIKSTEMSCQSDTKSPKYEILKLEKWGEIIMKDIHLQKKFSFGIIEAVIKLAFMTPQSLDYFNNKIFLKSSVGTIFIL